MLIHTINPNLNWIFVAHIGKLLEQKEVLSVGLINFPGCYESEDLLLKTPLKEDHTSDPYLKRPVMLLSRHEISNKIILMKRVIFTTLKSPWFWVVLAGYLLRILVMPVTGQHDVMFMPWMTHYINQGHFNLYAFLGEKFGDIVMQRPAVWAPYPYGFYFFTAGWLELLEKIGLVDLVNWESIWQVSHPARYVFLFKAAYLPFDLAIAYILFRTSGRVGLTLWAWSPTAIYTPFMMGQNDIYATCFAVAGTYAASQAIEQKKQKLASSSSLPNKYAVLSCILLGIGSVFKIYPIIMLPPLILIIETRWRQRLTLLCVGLSFMIIASLPFISTPAYINGVLLNPEGMNIFQEFQLFGINVSPFLLGYIILLIYLTADRPANPSPYLAWFTSLIVIALLFLWIPVPFYWLIWITPILIGVIDRIPKLLFTWLLLQLAFSLMLLYQHRELGIALPIHLASIFTMPNISTSLALKHPILYKTFDTLLPVINSAFVISLLFMIWFSVKAYTKKYQRINYNANLQWWGSIVLPTAAMFMLLTMNVFLSRNLVSRNNWYNWQEQTLTAGDYMLQELSTEYNVINGVRLRFNEATAPTKFKVCVYQESNINQDPLACASSNTTDRVENQVIYFLFHENVNLDNNEPLIIKIQVESNDGMITLPFTTSLNNSLQINETKLNGSLDISTLSSFSLSEALSKLIVENILKDTALLAVIGIVIALVILVLLIYFSKVPNPK